MLPRALAATEPSRRGCGSHSKARSGVGVVLLLGSACAVLLSMPWQGPIICRCHWSGIRRASPRCRCSRSRSAMCNGPTDGARRAGRPVAGPSPRPPYCSARCSLSRASAPSGSAPAARRCYPLAAVFDGSTVHADARRAVPVNRWSHLALTARRRHAAAVRERQPGVEPGDHRHHQKDDRPPVDWW